MKSIAGYSKAMSDTEKAYKEFLVSKEKSKDEMDLMLEAMDKDYFANKAAQSALKSAGISITIENGKICITQTGLAESETGEKKPITNKMKLSEEQYNAAAHIIGDYFKKKNKDSKNKENNYYKK